MASVRASLRVALNGLIPPPRMRMSTWIEANIRLPEGTSALSGPVRLFPPQVEIADAIGDPDLERVTLVKPVRVGFTMLLTSTIAGFVANDPAPILCYQPTDSDCRDWMVGEIDPILAESPATAGVLSPPERVGRKTIKDNPEERNTLMARRFPGGSLKVLAARSPRNFRRHTAKVLVLDEVDAMAPTVEGPAPLLAERRTLSYPDRKIVKGSTPTFTETSEVLRCYAQSDQRIYEVPCPLCGAFTEILWQHIVWDQEDGVHQPETARFHCPHCEEDVAETHKGDMVANGRWRALRPEVKGHAGFRINALVSTLHNAAWPKLVAEFLAAKNDPGLLQTFTNTILAQGWSGGGEDHSDADLMAQAQDFGIESGVPDWVLALTAGCDVQHDRIEVTVMGHAEDRRIAIVGQTVVHGAWDDDETWAELDAFLASRFPHALGGTIGISASAVDAGDGTTTKKVLAFCHARLKRKIMPIKGMAGNRALLERTKGKSRSGQHFFIVGVDTAKTQLFGRLSTPGSIEFSRDLPAVWFEQLTSERLVIRYHKGQPQRSFERIPGKRAEALDCVVYALAARSILNLDWERLRAELAAPQVPKPAKPKPKAPADSWIGDRGNDWLTARSSRF